MRAAARSGSTPGDSQCTLKRCHHEDDPTSDVKSTLMTVAMSFSTSRAYFLEAAERLPAALILEDGIRHSQRVPNPVGVELRAEALRDDVDVKS